MGVLPISSSVHLYLQPYNRWFSYMITTSILLNSICLALYDYTDRDSLTQRNQILELINQIFTYIYCAEALIKIGAMGFAFGEKTYLREMWNIIDFTIIIAG